jgi:hypothetical protein
MRFYASIKKRSKVHNFWDSSGHLVAALHGVRFHRKGDHYVSGEVTEAHKIDLLKNDPSVILEAVGTPTAVQKDAVQNEAVIVPSDHIPPPKPRGRPPKDRKDS